MKTAIPYSRNSVTPWSKKYWGVHIPTNLHNQKAWKKPLHPSDLETLRYRRWSFYTTDDLHFPQNELSDLTRFRGTSGTIPPKKALFFRRASKNSKSSRESSPNLLKSSKYLLRRCLDPQRAEPQEVFGGPNTYSQNIWKTSALQHRFRVERHNLSFARCSPSWCALPRFCRVKPGSFRSTGRKFHV